MPTQQVLKSKKWKIANNRDKSKETRLEKHGKKRKDDWGLSEFIHLKEVSILLSGKYSTMTSHYQTERTFEMTISDMINEGRVDVYNFIFSGYME